MSDIIKMVKSILLHKGLLEEKEDGLEYKGSFSSMIAHLKDVKLIELPEETREAYVRHNFPTLKENSIKYHILKHEGEDFKRIKSKNTNLFTSILFKKDVEPSVEKLPDTTVSINMDNIAIRNEDSKEISFPKGHSFNLKEYVIEEISRLDNMTNLEMFGAVTDPRFKKIISIAKNLSKNKEC